MKLKMKLTMLILILAPLCSLHGQLRHSAPVHNVEFVPYKAISLVIHRSPYKDVVLQGMPFNGNGMIHSRGGAAVNCGNNTANHGTLDNGNNNNLRGDACTTGTGTGGTGWGFGLTFGTWSAVGGSGNTWDYQMYITVTPL